MAGNEAMEELRGYARRAAMEELCGALGSRQGGEEPGAAALEPVAWAGATEAGAGRAPRPPSSNRDDPPPPPRGTRGRRIW